MPRGRPSPKLAITVDPDVHEGVKEAARLDQVSVSTWMTAAARAALTVRYGLLGVTEWETEHGTLSEAELADARQRVTRQLGDGAATSA